MLKNLRLIREFGLFILFGRVYFVPTFPRVRRFGRIVRGLFPAAYGASFYCCDSHRYYAGRVFLVAGDWHLNRIAGDLEGSSDGTQIYPITLRRFISLAFRGDLAWRD